MEKIKFSQNWNGKLNNKFFTTMRLSNKHTGTVEIWLKEEFLGLAEIIKTERFKSIYEIDEKTAALDTGYPSSELPNIFKRFYGNIDLFNTPVYLYLLKYKQRTVSKLDVAQYSLFKATV